jgi:hypothetical protein
MNKILYVIICDSLREKIETIDEMLFWSQEKQDWTTVDFATKYEDTKVEFLPSEGSFALFKTKDWSLMNSHPIKAGITKLKNKKLNKNTNWKKEGF